MPVAAVYDVQTEADATGGIPMKEPDMKYTLLQGLFNRDYFLMYLTLITNSYVLCRVGRQARGWTNKAFVHIYR